MKKLLFIESNTTGTGMIAIQKAHSLNLSPVFITRDPKLYNGLFEQDCQVITCETNHFDVVLETIKTIFDPGEIGGITTTSEFYIHTVSRLTSSLQLKGNPPETVAAARNKFTVREKLRKSKKLYQPFYFGITTEQELMWKKKEIAFPCIVKPVDDSGSNGVKVCREFTDLLDHTLRLLKVETNTRNQPAEKMALIEEYVEGQEYSLECFSFDGNHQLIGITKKKVGGEPFRVEQGHIFPAEDLTGAARERIKEGAFEILETLGWSNGPVHIEVKVVENKLFLVEFNGRLAGGMIPELIRLSSGIDMLQEQLKSSTGIQPDLQKTSNCYAGIQFFVPDKSGVITEINLIKDKHLYGIKEVRVNVDIGDHVDGACNAYGRKGYTIAVSDDVHDLMDTLLESSKQVKIKEKECIV
jgi:S-sulfo-L-cysteine synthase (3-phospho-L-serine-dependent)